MQLKLEKNNTIEVSGEDKLSSLKENQIYRIRDYEGYAEYWIIKKSGDKVVTCYANQENEFLNFDVESDDKIQYAVLDYNLVSNKTIQEFHIYEFEKYDRYMDLSVKDYKNMLVMELPIAIDKIFFSNDTVLLKSKEKKDKEKEIGI